MEGAMLEFQSQSVRFYKAVLLRITNIFPVTTIVIPCQQYLPITGHLR